MPDKLKECFKEGLKNYLISLGRILRNKNGILE